MGFFSSFALSSQKPAPASDAYTWDNVRQDNILWTQALFETLLFANARHIYDEYMARLAEALKAKESGSLKEAARLYACAQQFVLETADRLHYEQDLQQQTLYRIADTAVENLASVIETAGKCDGERSLQYFAGFALDKQKAAAAITKEVSQILSKEHAPCLHAYLADLETLQGSAADLSSSQEQDGYGSGAAAGILGGAAVTSNPLIGLGLIAAGLFDSCQYDKRTAERRKKLSALWDKWSVSLDRLDASQNAACQSISAFLAKRFGEAFDELGEAVSRYCTEYAFSMDAVCDAVFQEAADHGEIPAFDRQNEEEMAQLGKVARMLKKITASDSLSPKLKNYYTKVLESLS